MKERRSVSRQKSFLQGRIYFNNRRSSVDCLIRDYSEQGARLKFSESADVPEAMELYIPNKEEIHRARVEWRSGNEMGVSFGEEIHSPSIAPEARAGRSADACAEARSRGRHAQAHRQRAARRKPQAARRSGVTRPPAPEPENRTCVVSRGYLLGRRVLRLTSRQCKIQAWPSTSTARNGNSA